MLLDLKGGARRPRRNESSGVAGPKGDKGDPGEVGPQGVAGPKEIKRRSGAAAGLKANRSSWT